MESNPVYDTAMKKMDLESSIEESKEKEENKEGESSFTEENISEIETETVQDKRLPPAVNYSLKANHLKKNKGSRIGNETIKW